MDLQTITVVIAGISVIIGVINSILSSRRAAQNDQMMLETRQAQLFAQIHSWWRSRDGAKAYGKVRYTYNDFLQKMGMEDYLEKYGATGDIDVYADQMTLNAFFEGVGVLVKKGLIDIDLVEDLLSQRIIWYWENMLGSMVDYVREKTDDPTQYDSIEYLYHEMKHRQRLTARPEVNM
jgi:hypothetical protein